LTTVISSRGCPYLCNFCGNLNRGDVRYRSGENLRKELIELLENYSDLGGILFMDETFTLSRKHVFDVTSQIADLGLNYVITSRANRINSEIVKALKDSGCVEIKFGIETGSQNLLNKMNKHADIEQYKKGVKVAASGGLYTKLCLMHGFPGENEETTTATIKVLEELQPFVRRVALYRFVPLPGSFVYNEKEKFQLLLDSDLTKYHIYHNEHHWWGSKEDFRIVREQYSRLESKVIQLFERVN